jgi:hypothetical protein
LEGPENKFPCADVFALFHLVPIRSKTCENAGKIVADDERTIVASNAVKDLQEFRQRKKLDLDAASVHWDS